MGSPHLAGAQSGPIRARLGVHTGAHRPVAAGYSGDSHLSARRRGSSLWACGTGRVGFGTSTWPKSRSRTTAARESQGTELG